MISMIFLDPTCSPLFRESSFSFHFMFLQMSFNHRLNDCQCLKSIRGSHRQQSFTTPYTPYFNSWHWPLGGNFAQYLFVIFQHVACKSDDQKKTYFVKTEPYICVGKSLFQGWTLYSSSSVPFFFQGKVSTLISRARSMVSRQFHQF